MIDTHAHLAMTEHFPSDQLDAVLAEAWASGLTGIVIPAGATEENESIPLLVQKDPRLFGMIGFHPEHALKYGPMNVEGLREGLKQERIVGIGEAGLDFYWKDDAATRGAQVDLCEAQLALAEELDLPISLHLRDIAGRLDAADALMDLLREHKVRAIIHSCTAPIRVVEELLRLGCMISYSGIVTFPSAAEVREGAAAVPLERLLIETDAPYLAPVPHRGKTNVPAYARATADYLAKERGEDAEMLWATVGANARRVLGLA